MKRYGPSPTNWLGSFVTFSPVKDSTGNGEVSITPLHVDLTDHATLPVWRRWIDKAAG